MSRDRLFELLKLLLGQLHANVLVGDTLVAIDACLSGFNRVEMLLTCARALKFGRHGLEVVTVAALARVRLFHRAPDIACQVQTPRLEFLRRIDGAENLVQEFIGSFDLADEFMHPRIGHMAIGADSPNAGAVMIMDCRPVFLEDGVAHLMA